MLFQQKVVLSISKQCDSTQCEEYDCVPEKKDAVIHETEREQSNLLKHVRSDPTISLRYMLLSKVLDFSFRFVLQVKNTSLDTRFVISNTI